MRACLATIALVLLPSAVQAQDPPSAAVMAVGGTIGVEATAWIESMDAIEARLREAGFRLDESGLPRRDDCAELDCLREERAGRGVDVLVTLTLFGDEAGSDAVGSVVVTMVDATGQFAGDEDVEGRVVGTVAALALAEARTARERGRAPWLRIDGTAGAIVRVDGREAGIVPYEGRLSPGSHRVEVALGGRAPFAREVEAHPGDTIALDATLDVAGNDDTAAAVLLGLAGAAAIGGGIAVGLGADWNGLSGRCLDTGAPPCERYIGPGAGDGAVLAGGVQLGAAAALAIVGVLVLVVD